MSAWPQWRLRLLASSLRYIATVIICDTYNAWAWISNAVWIRFGCESDNWLVNYWNRVFSQQSQGERNWQWFLASAGVTHEKYSPSDLLRIKLAYAISTSQTKPRHARITPLRKNKPGRILLWVQFANTNLPSKKLSCTLLKVSKEAKSLAISVALGWIYVKQNYHVIFDEKNLVSTKLFI